MPAKNDKDDDNSGSSERRFRSRTRRPRKQNVVVVDNTQFGSTGINSKYLTKMLRYLETRQPHMTVLTVRTLDEYKRVEAMADYIVMSGSSADIPDLERDDRRQSLGSYVVRQTLRRDSPSPPVLGVCFGAQFLNDEMGGSLKQLPKMLCGKRIVSWSDKTSRVQFCLNFLPDNLGSGLRSLASLQSAPHAGTVVAFEHSSCPLFGTLFHPEANEDGHALLDRFFKKGKL